ncbi:hypothetical protein C923_05061 [Plasmodium falciparum UGT5.1]|uniref:MPN domain-containing protein n=2 Tax=Plasmodium falciparum TaxID=5833 RepID=W7JRQ9_PLAFA|nr:hypothetical protein C923_05061 [Plasmodium falciparum UGT5.1]
MLKKDLFLFFLFFCFFLQQKNILCSYKECSLLTDDIRILSYCKNESKCFIKNFNNSEYSSITCICKKYLNESFFAGPDCEIVDEYTIRIVDVFAMPQSGNSVSVEAVDPVYQTNMLEELKKTGRHEMVVGWYHSHPGFGCWLSGTDVNTQKSFEQLNPRTIGVVVDPIQSVKGKVVIDCFRLINPHILMLGQEPRQTTSNIGYLTKPTLTALVHGLNRNYYSIVINYRKNELEKNMLLNLHKDMWTNPLKLNDFHEQKKSSDETLEDIKKLTTLYNKNLRNEMKKTSEEILLENIGKIDAKKRIQNSVETLLNESILTCIGTMANTLFF